MSYVWRVDLPLHGMPVRTTTKCRSDAGAAGGPGDDAGGPAAAGASLVAPPGAAMAVLRVDVDAEGRSVEAGEGWCGAPDRTEEEPCRERVKANML